ncbi:hypothetical protein WA1_36835 [Scytonema hofmannii PCC 7110]|uniref:Uncharacterized protein n=1 Tax=Scytonema hofmannii PCC 7110 TaxID=128403 RepID=A0A139X213_9CYAN|nr:hypothetical protein [Scytonema hofmannii]KYC38735.1 hypothetical protein WA1_36835 [Scytonema hofmannii PCC 7110]
MQALLTGQIQAHSVEWLIFTQIPDNFYKVGNLSEIVTLSEEKIRVGAYILSYSVAIFDRLFKSPNQLKRPNGSGLRVRLICDNAQQ